MARLNLLGKILSCLFFLGAASSHAYLDTAKKIGSSSTQDLYLYTGSIKAAGTPGDYHASLLSNFTQPRQDGTRSVFYNIALHCAGTGTHEATLMIHVGHKEAWGQGEQTFNTSDNVGKRFATIPQSWFGLAHAQVCALHKAAVTEQPPAPPPKEPKSSPDSPRGFKELSGRRDGWGGVECDPGVHPDNWHNCNVLQYRLSMYRGGLRQGSPAVSRFSRCCPAGRSARRARAGAARRRV